MSKEPDEDKGLGNLFKIVDGLVEQMHRTKRMFIIMILTVMILPPVALFFASLVNEPPFPGIRRPGPGFGPYDDPMFSFIKQLPLIISSVWLGVGIYQWYVLSKWTKRYDRYKERQRRAEEKLGDIDDQNSNQEKNQKNP